MNRIASICEGDRGVARDVASRAFRRFPDDLVGGKEVAVVGLDQCLKIPVVKKREWRQAGTTR